MQKYKQAAISIAFLTIILSGGASNGLVRIGENSSNRKPQGQEESILETFENGDYDSWKKIIGKKGGSYSTVSQNEFDKFVSARKFARRGEYDRAIALARSVEKTLKEKFASPII